jgi:hypothetical protein
MNNSANITFTKTNLTAFIALLGIASLAPITGNQFITGTIVNADLLIAVSLLGIPGGLAIAVIPSFIALTTGLLPVVLAPMVPFIILGNILFVLVFAYLKNRNYWLGAFGGAILKSSFLAGMIAVVTNLIINNSLAGKAAYMMSWPQLVTALAGSLLAFVLLGLDNKRTKSGS